MQRKINTATEQRIYKDKLTLLRQALIEGEGSGVSDRKIPDIIRIVKNRHNILKN